MTRRVDPVTLQVIVSRLSGIVQEMQDSIFRTGYSTIVRESHDASCMLLDADGDVVGEHVDRCRCTSAACRRSCARSWRPSATTCTPGDAFITNHPYVGGVPHSMDMAVVDAGVLRRTADRVLRQHRAQERSRRRDSRAPATASARELFQEGIQYPPVRLVAAAQSRATSRRSCARTAARRISSSATSAVRSASRGSASGGSPRRSRATASRRCSRCSATVHDVSERALARGARKLARRRARGRGVRRHRRDRSRPAHPLSRAGREDAATASTSTSPAATIRSQARSTSSPALARGCCYYALIAFVDPTLPNNGGVARVVETTFRRGLGRRSELPGAVQHVHGVDDRGHRDGTARR